MEFTQNEDAKNLPERFLLSLRRWSTVTEFIYNVAMMRYYQKTFFKDRTHAMLEKAKDYERKVDDNLDRLWPSGQPKTEQLNLLK